MKTRKNQAPAKPQRPATPANRRPEPARKASGIETQPENEMVLGRRNYLYMCISGAMIVVGFLLMLGPSATVENFEPDIFSTRRIVVGPLVAFLGFVAMAISIIVARPKK